MKIKHIVMVLLPILVITGCQSIPAEQGMPNQEGTLYNYLLLDNFQTEKSTTGNSWEGFTDRVMGGRSDMSIVRVQSEENAYLRMSGQVSLENNGGFIQIRLSLGSKLKAFDASSFKGIRLTVRGNEASSGYYIFARTTSNWFPWKFFKAAIPTTEQWQTIDIPWSSFGSGDYGRTGNFDPGKLTSIALVAYGKAFFAELEVSEIGLYR